MVVTHLGAPTVQADEAALAAREVRPETKRHLWLWVQRFTGLKIADRAVCQGHSAPFDLFARQVLEEPAMELWQGPRGSGKSVNSAIKTHIQSRFRPGVRTKILGGSLAQSEQAYQAIEQRVVKGRGPLGSDRDAIDVITKRKTLYHNGSVVETLAASETSVRGPHAPFLNLDEIDVMDSSVREDAVGIAQEQDGQQSSILMTSTWHKVNGPMAELMELGRSGAFPVSTFCVFEVLERCPEERSGANLEKCPECPLFRWCHEDMGGHASGVPKAKRSNGHYRIRDLIAKLAGVSRRLVESDYLCLKPRADKIWFTEFDRTKHVSVSAEYDRRRWCHVAIDPGVHTGGVLFQVRPRRDGLGIVANAFADYYAEGKTARANAAAIRDVTNERCGTGIGAMRVSMDRSANDRNAVGVLVAGEYHHERCVGRNGIESWISTPGSVKDTLELISLALESADGEIGLIIHPRCEWLIKSLENYERKKVRGQWTDDPVDPQHPWEELVDCLRHGLKLEQPEGRTPPAHTQRVHASRVI
jgi:hypothetical protein